MDMLHASAVAFDGQGVLLLGPSGSGKSTLALQLIALGGCLIADDRVLATEKEGRLWLEPPDTIADRIEARGLGLLSCESAPAFASLAVDLTRIETERLPVDAWAIAASASASCARWAACSSGDNAVPGIAGGSNVG